MQAHARAGTVRDPVTGELSTNTPIPTLKPSASPAPTAPLLRTATSTVATSAVRHVTLLFPPSLTCHHAVRAVMTWEALMVAVQD